MRKALILSLIILFLTTNTAFAFNPSYQFTDQERDFESGLYYFDAREYNPVIGKFLQPDPLLNSLTDPQKLKETTGLDLDQFLMDPQKLNSYSYTENNPINYIDPTGEATLKARLLYPQYISFWKTVSMGLNAFGYNISAYFLNHAVRVNPGAMNIKVGHDQHNVISKIQSSTEYQDFMKARIKEAEDAGQTEINFQGGLNTLRPDDTIVFNGGDLKYSIKKVTNTYIIGTKLNNGLWDIQVKLYDKYDFDPGAYPENGNLLNQGISTGVNWAKDSEKKQVITNYHINIEFKNQFGG